MQGRRAMTFEEWWIMLRAMCDLCYEEYPTESEARRMHGKNLEPKEALDLLIDERSEV